jgi:hypothetical protein
MRNSVFLLLAAVGLLSTACSPQAQAPLSTYVMGEKVQLGHLSYTIFETQWMTHLGDGANARVPQNRFYLVRMSAVNGGAGDAAVPNPTIQDDHGTVYEELSNGDGVPQWAGYLRTAKPADSVQGNMVFDAPPGHYKLKLTDETGTKAAIIDIPLSFGAETPEVVAPGEKK